MRTVCFLTTLLGSGCFGCGLAVADDPDPRTVLNEARTLAREGRYEEALQKHIWFHENALKHERSLLGVRLSFALTDWVKLGQSYPKAREALTAIRDNDTRLITAGDAPSELFQDVTAINHYLEEEPRTVDLFKTLHEKYPGLARRSYVFGERELAAAREYTICSSYIPDAIQKFDRIKQIREMNLRLAKDGRQQLKDYAEKSFVESTCRLIDILIGAGRRADAETVREQALAVRDDPQVRDAIEKSFQSERKKDQ